MTGPAYGPEGRGRWRLTLHPRTYVTNAASPAPPIAELVEARSRRLEQTWGAPAQLTFTIDGHSPGASAMLELATEVIGWRYDYATSADVAMFRGVIDHTEDQINEQSHIVNVTCHDYLALLTRRYLTSTMTATGLDQDVILQNLLAAATNGAVASNGTSFAPGSYLPLLLWRVNPDGSQRVGLSNGGTPSAPLRDRTYYGSQEIGQAILDLSLVLNGFDIDVHPQGWNGPDQLRIFYPKQGVVRSDMALVYGANVSAVTRNVNSSTYANYQRVLGNNGSSDPAAAQKYSEAWNSDANNVSVNPVGLWAATDNASDVTVQSTLDGKAAGDLAWSGLVAPSYTLALTPDAWRLGYPNMGDTVPIAVRSGRLAVSTSARVVGINFAISDDGSEDVELVVGRPTEQLADIFAQGQNDIDALARR